MVGTTSITLELHNPRAAALAELVKRALRQNLGPDGLDLASAHSPGDKHEMEQALHDLRRALAAAGFDWR